VVLLALFLGAQAKAEVWAGREVVVTGDRAQQQFAAAERVRIEANVSDDVFAAGREVTVERARAHSLIAAAGRLIVRDSNIRDMFAAGLDVEFRGSIEDDAVVAVCPVCWWGSGRLLVGAEGRIGDDARLAAGTLEIEGSIGGNLHAAARRIVISGSVGGIADLTAKEIVIASGARLGGELIARSPAKPEIASGATISGPMRHIETEVNLPDPEDVSKAIAVVAVVASVALGLGVLLLGVLGQVAVPGLLYRSAERVRAEVWGSIGRGLAWALLLPAISALLFATLIGIPAAIVLLACFMVLLVLAFVTSGYAIGLWLRHRRPLPQAQPGIGGRIGWTLLGIVILMMAWVIPFLGWIFALLALLAGLGAVAGRISTQARATETAAASVG
jgi:cytoskeletal protein CcmA (bactofilin family)